MCLQDDAVKHRAPEACRSAKTIPMTTQQTVTAVMIHLLMPLAGIILFAWLYRLMIKSSIPQPPVIPMFLLFITLGGWLLVALTVALWQWSGMASLGVFFLALAGPWLTLGSALRLRTSRDKSPFHKWIFRLSAAYTGVMLATIIVWISVLMFQESNPR